MTGNHAREGGGAIFFVSNDRSGILEIRSSTLRDNPSNGFETRPRHLLPRPRSDRRRLGREVTQPAASGSA